ncbi:MAG: DUF503 domain-containing protein [Actinobacteria bacterium]|nr:DUF503 domain-containing protein [Actinomycetota bacterium]
MASDGTVFVGVARVELRFPGVGSLKGKRAVLNKARAGLQRTLDCSVAEVGAQDLWQRTVLGVTVAASSEMGADRVLDRIVPVLERDPRLEVIRIDSYIESWNGEGP